jgi:diamine N-acetyltransferase
MKIREAKKSDLKEISKLSYEYGKYENKLDKEVESASIKKSEKLDKHFMDLGTIYFLAEEDGKTKGVLSINIRKQGKEKKGVLHTMIITKDSRGKGYGNALVNHAMNYFKKNGCRRIGTFVHFKNKKAKAFWEGQGFEMEHGYLASKELKLK